MEKREDRVIVWLSAEEKDRLERISAEHCMKRGDVLRAAIMGTDLIEPPDENLREIRRSLDRIESETEMLAYLAARDGFSRKRKRRTGKTLSKGFWTGWKGFSDSWKESGKRFRKGGRRCRTSA